MSRAGVYFVAYCAGVTIGWVLVCLIDGWPS